MAYVDGFLLPLPKKKLQEWGGKTHKSLFPKTVRAKPGETVVFSWIVFKSKADRDRVNDKVMKDARMAKMMAVPMPFDMKRMAYGGFKVVVDL